MTAPLTSEQRVFVSNDFLGFWPVGTAAVIVAANEDDARRYLNNALTARGLDPNQGGTLRELVNYGAEILCDGNY